MWQIVKNVFSPSQYMPHGHCYLWQTPLVWLHVVSDLLIAVAYFSIPAMLIYFVFKRRDVPFLGIFALFGAFIIFCGMGHLLEIWTLWHSAYWLSGIEKAITALISCYTAGQMVTLLPKFLSLKTPQELEVINHKLQREISERENVELELRCAYEDLEIKVQERTTELTKINACLEAEIRERIAAESALREREIRLSKQQASKLELAKSDRIYQGNIGDALREITEIATRTLNVEWVSVWFYNEDKSAMCCGNLYKLTANQHSDGLELRVDDYPNYFKALNAEQTIAAVDANTDPRTQEFSESYLIPLGISSMLDVPITHQGRVEGVICLSHQGTPRNWTLDEQNFASYLAQIVALAMESRDRILAQEALHKQLKRERLVGTMLDRIRSSLNLESVLQTSVDEVRQFLQTDRTIVYRFNPDWSGFVVVESVGKDWMPTLEMDIQDNCFLEKYVPLYKEGRIGAISDVENSSLNLCHIKLLRQLQVKANLVIPILQAEEATQNPKCGGTTKNQCNLWGLLIAHHCSSSREWQEFEIECLKELNVQLAIALQQCTLFEQAQTELSDRKQAEAALRLSEAREREKARQLEVTLRQLKSTQAQIVQSEKMASLGQMVAGVAHEINNPVSFIYGNVTPAIEYSHYLLNAIDLYQQHYPEPPAAIKEQIEAVEFDFIKEDFIKLLESMKTGAERIKQIVLSLRNFSHLDEADRKPANLNQDIESTLMILQHRLKPQPRRCAIEVIREYGKLPLVECYPGQLNQVFMNLLSNAIDALEERLQRDPNFTPQIRICTEVKNNLDKSHIKSAIVRIADNGAGISEEVKQRIFDPFFTTKPVGKGTGLGLSISHQIIVEKHQGRLECYSQLGQGTEFLIELNFCVYNTDIVVKTFHKTSLQQ
ncbi:GAF domain-containing protein [Argonema antarcticum]|uniref:GAF domain-containing protein n=1 Tax=Argonema antarcticum TaxID=2942763 RepID=UPI00201209E0|nr:GAF domain-containing protein [Argonema antarcticum]MCL1470898.1 GAF domain-containing protein [Argonema antarcticum A004/B2]